jgi:ribonucleoside-diphosphate reductase alpha chain
MRTRLPDVREGKTLHFKILARGEENPYGSAEVKEVDGYVTLNPYPDGRLGEIFVKVGKAGDSAACFDSWAKQASHRLQEGCSVEQVFRTHVGERFGDSGTVRHVDGVARCTSILDLVAQVVLKRFGNREAA